jgi:hypothetical protein
LLSAASNRGLGDRRDTRRGVRVVAVAADVCGADRSARRHESVCDELLGVIATSARGVDDIASAIGACEDGISVPEAEDLDEFIWMV